MFQKNYNYRVSLSIITQGKGYYHERMLHSHMLIFTLKVSYQVTAHVRHGTTFYVLLSLQADVQQKENETLQDYLIKR